MTDKVKSIIVFIERNLNKPRSLKDILRKLNKFCEYNYKDSHFKFYVEEKINRINVFANNIKDIRKPFVYEHRKHLLIKINQIMHDILEEMDEIDIFDFDKYDKEYKLFSKYFKDVELYIRLSIFLDYKYNHIKKENEREELDIECNSKKELIKLTNEFSIEITLQKFYLHFNPSKMSDVDNLLIKYINCEDIMFARLYKKYIDDDYKPVKLWFNNPEGDSRLTTY